jgi:hypothetical protein
MHYVPDFFHAQIAVKRASYLNKHGIYSSSSSLGERVQQEGKDTVRLLGSMGNREMTFAVGKVSCE